MKKILTIATIAIFFVAFIAYEVLIIDDQDLCLDSGVCKAGLELNTEKGKIIINQQTCQEINGEWQEELNRCKF